MSHLPFIPYAICKLWNELVRGIFGILPVSYTKRDIDFYYRPMGLETVIVNQLLIYYENKCIYNLNIF